MNVPAASVNAPQAPQTPTVPDALRHDWTRAEILGLFARPFMDLLFDAQQAHRAHFDPNAVQISTLLSIKTGACPEDCGYCSQSARHDTGLERERLLPLDEVVAAARAAKAKGATRFCMGAAWRNPTDTNLDRVAEMVGAVHDLGLETCVTLGMLSGPQARRLREAGLDYYNHNLDTSPEHYPNIVSTHTFDDRLRTKEYGKAAKKYLEAAEIAVSPLRADDLIAAAQIHLQAGELAEAKALYERAIEQFPGSPRARDARDGLDRVRARSGS